MKEKYYKVETVEGKTMIKRIRRPCPKCGPGVFMAEHADRISCGRCGYTEFKKGS